MYKGKRILAVVPARGGSKGIKLKNLRHVAGKSLVGWAGAVLAQTEYVDRRVVSTDHAAIVQEAVDHKIEAPFLRPEELAGDFISDLQVLKHALISAETHYGEKYDVILMLQPTSPGRTPGNVSDTVRKLIDDDLDAVWTVSPTDLKFHPLKQLVINPDGLMDYFSDEGKKIIARQQLKPVYHRNGVCYAFTRDCLLRQDTIKGARTGAVVIEGKLPNIDTVEDLAYAEEFVRKMNLS
jgi:CMP-N,N'-diacetyllegionaminic acid synthase